MFLVAIMADPFLPPRRNDQTPTFVILEQSMEHALWSLSMTTRKQWEDRRICRIASLGKNVPVTGCGVSGQSNHRALLPNAPAPTPRQRFSAPLPTG
jgi:hypothetical protein